MTGKSITTTMNETMTKIEALTKKITMTITPAQTSTGITTMTKITITKEAMTKLEALTKTTGSGTMTDYLVEQLRMDWDSDQSLLSQVTSWHNQRRIAADALEALTAERDRLLEALTELLEISRRAVRLSVEHENFKLYAMEPMERAILLSRAALKGESHE